MSLFQKFRRLSLDPGVLILSLMPVMVGVGLYYLLGRFVFIDIYEWGMALIESYFSNFGDGYFLSAISGIFIFCLTIIFFVFVNFTFVLCVSLIACPFNDFLSTRVTRIIYGHEASDEKNSFMVILLKLTWIIFNEIKKFFFIVIFGLIAFVLSFIFPPLALIISSILVAVSFVDYSWGRDDLKIMECWRNIRHNFVSYFICGIVFLFMIGIPMINIFTIPFGVIFFTLIYEQSKREQ